MDLYTFKKLKNYLNLFGYKIEEREPWVTITKELTFEEQSTKVRFTRKGAEYTDKNGKKWYGYIYKKYFHFGHGEQPRMHLCHCNTIENSGRGQYVFTNSIKLICYNTSNNSKEKVEENPRLCQNCAKIREGKGWKNYKNAKDFLNDIYDDNMKEEHTINRWGYTKDWYKVKKDYLISKQCKCESCGIELSHTHELQYINVYHRNEDNSDNSPNNLICQCIECYAKSHNDMTKAQKALLHSYKVYINGEDNDTEDKHRFKQLDLFDSL